MAAISSQALRGLLSILVLGIGFRVACVRTTPRRAGLIQCWTGTGATSPQSIRTSDSGTAYIAGFLE
ncbi:hypothetical protein MY11210_006530 [Beauveria gryllotalpidicola]